MTANLTLLKNLIGEDLQLEDDVLQYYLDIAADIICDRRNTDVVEDKFVNIQYQIAIQLINKRGIEGESSHSELGVSTSFENSSVSESLLNKIPIMLTTPFSEKRIV